jgi:hypothetical protein
LPLPANSWCGIDHYWRRRPAGLKKQLLGFGHTQICAIFPKTKVRGIMPFSPGFNLSEALDLVTLSAIIEDRPTSRARRLDKDIRVSRNFLFHREAAALAKCFVTTIVSPQLRT